MLGRMKFEINLLVSEILDNLPNSIWTSKTSTFLDPAIGGGQFVREIESRLMKAGHDIENISNRVFGYEEFEHRITYAVNKHKLVGKYKQGDFLEMEFKPMKFTVVVGNPPYQKKSKHGKKVNDNLWAPFTFKGWDLLQDNGYICFITPDGWRTPTNDLRTERKGLFKDILKPYKTIAINLNECEKYFNVGSTISYFVVQKILDNHSTSVMTTNFGKETIDLNKLPLIPRDLSKEGFSIFNKVVLSKGNRWKFFQKQTNLNKSLRINISKTKEFPYKFFDSHGSAEIKYCNKQGENHNDSKVMLSYVGKYKVMADDGQITPAQHAHRELIDKQHLASAESQLNSKIFKFIIEGNRSNQYIEKHIPNIMPKLDLNKVWTNNDIYEYFKLTKKEIDYVEDNVE